MSMCYVAFCAAAYGKTAGLSGIMSSGIQLDHKLHEDGQCYLLEEKIVKKHFKQWWLEIISSCSR